MQFKLVCRKIIADAIAKKSYNCGHCSKELSKTRYFQHRKLFYNKRTKEWSQQRVFETRLGKDFNFSDNETDSCTGTYYIIVHSY